MERRSVKMNNLNRSGDWRNPPEKIKEDEIEKEFSANVIVIGLGNAGTPALRAAAEAGASVIGIEQMKEEKFWIFGRDVGHINSDFLASRGVPKVDPIEFYNEWMRRSGNRANPGLVMQFCKKSGEAFNWFTETFTKEQMDSVMVEYWPVGSKFTGEISGHKFWAGTAQFDEKGLFAPGTVQDQEEKAKKEGFKLRFGMDARKTEGIFSLSHAMVENQEIAKKHGAEIHFNMDALQLDLDNKRVVGVIAKNGNDQYIKYRAKKGVILATGDFGGNKQMCHDLIPDIVDMFDEGEHFRSMGRDGKGIQMGVWAGGRLEARPLATMGGNLSVPVGVLSNFGALWLNENGRRYCNEGFGDPVFAGFPGIYEKHGVKTVVFDSDILEVLQSGPPSHMAFWVNNEFEEKQLTNNMEAARLAGPEGHRIGRSRLYAADTLDELAEYIGLEENIKQNFIKSIKRYNEACSIGRDEEFGKDPKLLHKVDKPPFYAQTLREGMTGFSIGYFLVTVGGLLTNEYQNVLDQNKDPIPGLYATGNCCGRRFGLQYSTPVAGVSIGIAITLGREAGRIVAEL